MYSWVRDPEALLNAGKGKDQHSISPNTEDEANARFVWFKFVHPGEGDVGHMHFS
jgi:hypothetical protein